MKEAKAKRGTAPVEAKDKKANDKKRSLSVKEKKPKKRQSRTDAKAKKDPNQPKRPPTAFFIFLEEFRKSFKEKHPDVKGVTAVGKACGEKWKEMSEEEKAPYNAKAVQKRAEYDKSLTAYKKKQGNREEGGTPEESEKSKSEINDDDDDDEEDSGDDGDEE